MKNEEAFQTYGRTDGQTDGRTDGRTDRPSYRDARTHLETAHQIYLLLQNASLSNQEFKLGKYHADFDHVGKGPLWSESLPLNVTFIAIHEFFIGRCLINT